MLQRLILATVVLWVIVLGATPARAQNRIDQAKQEVAAADIDYRLGRFDDALAKYSRAYEIYPVPALLFNIGQCHKNLKNYDKAIFFFEGYLRDAPKAANRALVEDLLREARVQQAKLASQPPAPPDPVPTPRGPTGEDPRAAPPPDATPPDAPPPQIAPSPITPSPAIHSEQAPRRSLVVPVGLIGAGVAAIAGGAVFYYYGQKRGPDEKYVYDDTRLLGGTMMVLGSASIVTGVVLLVHRRSSAPVAAVAPNGGYLGWVWQL